MAALVQFTITLDTSVNPVRIRLSGDGTWLAEYDAGGGNWQLLLHSAQNVFTPAIAAECAENGTTSATLAEVLGL